MKIAAGIDVGSSAVKAVVVLDGPAADSGGMTQPSVLAKVRRRLRKRDVMDVARETFEEAARASGVERIDYIATTGDGEEIPFSTGHFYGMTTHARGALFLEPRARTVLDVGALHARAVSMDERGKVIDYRMTSQCASGSGQFLESISRYIGVTQAEVGPLSLAATNPEKPSSICAVLAETDVINMVSRGITTADILRGIHESMAGRYAQLLRSLGVGGVSLLTGGLAADVGLVAALNEELATEAARNQKAKGHALEVVTHQDSVFAGALGAALWGLVRHAKVGGIAWTAEALR